MKTYYLRVSREGFLDWSWSVHDETEEEMARNRTTAYLMSGTGVPFAWLALYRAKKAYERLSGNRRSQLRILKD